MVPAIARIPTSSALNLTDEPGAESKPGGAGGRVSAMAFAGFRTEAVTARGMASNFCWLSMQSNNSCGRRAYRAASTNSSPTSRAPAALIAVRASSWVAPGNVRAEDAEGKRKHGTGASSGSILAAADAEKIKQLRTKYSSAQGRTRVTSGGRGSRRSYRGGPAFFL